MACRWSYVLLRHVIEEYLNPFTDTLESRISSSLPPQTLPNHPTPETSISGSPSTVFQTCTSKFPKSAYSELPNIVNPSANTQDEFMTAFNNMPTSVRRATSTLGASDYTGTQVLRSISLIAKKRPPLAPHLAPDFPKESPLQLDKYDFDELVESHNLLPDPLVPPGPCHQVVIINLENDMIPEASPANPTSKKPLGTKNRRFHEPFLAKWIR
ncbi:hypothetical protein PAAG_05274 [Paracoccidioides lutzii Pb01]|uniref:Uncharacterized protein n=1 Tax=Paracoccidioides lutzii (strain ATCC MYA-826 / Pb01) TaxID=502779 RepID=C1H3D1_PARBA|nr:hypothetical protein PAAG_05274 [Paracoccidioides lutzii Pb01]EEH34225.1 hypothetical protein PAAG_05274 [Paracoccidioides lutzii Pb01]